MQHRRFPRIPELDVSRLGLGAMRLPMVGGDAVPHRRGGGARTWCTRPSGRA